MKKRIIAVLLLVCSLFVLCSCALNAGAEQTYSFSNASVHLQVDGYEYMDDTMEFVYEETFLKIFSDGTWVIDMEMFLFLNSNIDQGTYTLENGRYTFEGFEYGMDAVGQKTASGFEIDFYIPLPSGYEKYITLYFE